MPSKIITEQLGSGMTAHTRRRKRYDFTQPVTKEEAAEIRHFFESFRPRDPIQEARGLAERTLAAIEAGDTDKDDFKPYAGMGWYSREIIKRCNWLVKAKERGDDPGRFTELGYEIGVLITEARMKAAWDEDVQTALTTEEQRKRGGGSNRKHPAATYLDCYRQFRADGLNKTDATDQAAKKLGVSPATIRNARKEAGASD